ncbi:MAG: insulinase family protein [Fibrobacteraceae bacterium]|nr:insulinase family protein [Fibrobacteraceae bacterium]
MYRQKIQKTELKNGVTVLTDYMPGVESATVGAWIPRGSRHEALNEFGLSHFYEHLVFKGTKNRTAFDIARSIEDRGGNLEAYTTRQETGFYANVVHKDVPYALDVIADMLMNPLFDPKEMEKERKVIIEEIRSYDDIPEELAGDLFNQIHFDGCGIAHPITGTVLDVRGLDHQQMLLYQQDVLKRIPIIVCAAGKVDHQRLVDVCQEKFAQKKAGNKFPQDFYACNGGYLAKAKQDIQQSNLFWGTSFDPSLLPSNFRFAFSLFNVAMGAGMASRLFQKIREERGLAYSVYSTVDVYRDCYDWGVSLATDPRRIGTALDLARQELKKFLNEGFGKTEMERTRCNILGGLRISSDNPEKRAMRLAEQVLHLGFYKTVDEDAQELLSMGADEVLAQMRRAFNQNPFAISLVYPKGTAKPKF